MAKKGNKVEVEGKVKIEVEGKVKEIIKGGEYIYITMVY